MAIHVLMGALISAAVWECLTMLLRIGSVPIIQRLGIMGIWMGMYFAMFHFEV
ncbi:hypothetical protein PHOBOS_107 [Erwinia phage vB_EamM_Phobos]|uniref:hypothetical protein n=1 Tax=Erwinia phage vB_EamM_Phobos TaxID=1883377 RepID=UPI00081CB475|nr:hypothetical protein BIZ79_gp107 [Erwinia phage vB_EamM_Phobos]ANZ50297.1 hypothetical protein PHOBOS_107 [Erwinia phage vB_EamM_Phobos]